MLRARFFLSVLTAAFCPDIAVAQCDAPPFPGAQYSTRYAPLGVAIANVTGDGHPDVLTANTSGSVAILEFVP